MYLTYEEVFLTSWDSNRYKNENFWASASNTSSVWGLSFIQTKLGDHVCCQRLFNETDVVSFNWQTDKRPTHVLTAYSTKGLQTKFHHVPSLHWEILAWAGHGDWGSPCACPQLSWVASPCPGRIDTFESWKLQQTAANCCRFVKFMKIHEGSLQRSCWRVSSCKTTQWRNVFKLKLVLVREVDHVVI